VYPRPMTDGVHPPTRRGKYTTNRFVECRRASPYGIWANGYSGVFIQGVVGSKGRLLREQFVLREQLGVCWIWTVLIYWGLGILGQKDLVPWRLPPRFQISSAVRVLV
jgi:hypothetical protein